MSTNGNNTPTTHVMKRTLSILAISAFALGATLSAAETLETTITEMDVMGLGQSPVKGGVLAKGATIINTKTLGVVVYDENETADTIIKAPFELNSGYRVKNYKVIGTLPTSGDELVLDLADVLDSRNTDYSVNPAPPWGSYLESGAMMDEKPVAYLVVNFDNVDFAEWFADSPMTITGLFSGGVRATGYIISATCDSTDSDSTQGGIVFFNKDVAPAVLAAEVTPSSGNIPEPTTATLSLLALAGLAARRRRV